jgi:hypothetical protein
MSQYNLTQAGRATIWPQCDLTQSIRVRVRSQYSLTQGATIRSQYGLRQSIGVRIRPQYPLWKNFFLPRLYQQAEELEEEEGWPWPGVGVRGGVVHRAYWLYPGRGPTGLLRSNQETLRWGASQLGLPAKYVLPMNISRNSALFPLCLEFLGKENISWKSSIEKTGDCVHWSSFLRTLYRTLSSDPKKVWCTSAAPSPLLAAKLPSPLA